MQHRGTVEAGAGMGAGLDRKRVEAVLQTLAGSQGGGESLAELAHDARNMVAALGLYCDLLEEPGVLAQPYAHYGEELRLVAAASRRLVEKLVVLDESKLEGAKLGQSAQPGRPAPPAATPPLPFWHPQQAPGERWPAWLPASRGGAPGEPVPGIGVENLAGELLATRNLLSALAGPAIVVTVDAVGGARPIRITAEDLTRVLVNLVKNAVEAMPSGGRIQIGLREHGHATGAALLLTVEDTGPGIAEEALERIFESGYSGHAREVGHPAPHRGLGLAIARAIVTAAGGSIHAENRATGGARLVLELPVRA